MQGKFKFHKYHYLLIFMTLTFIGLPILKSEAKTVDEEVEEFREYETRPEKTVYLTFDDGPSVYTTKLLEILKEYDVPAIFFITGESMEIVPNSNELINDILNENHHIGLHSMSHDRDRLYYRGNSAEIFVEEMLELQKLIFEITDGYETNLCRAPFGAGGHFSQRHWETVENAGLYCIDWHVDSLDWAKRSSGEIYNQVMSEYLKVEDKNQLVLLFHEKKLTLEVLPAIINFFREKGYTFVPYLEGEVIQVLNEETNEILLNSGSIR